MILQKDLKIGEIYVGSEKNDNRMYIWDCSCKGGLRRNYRIIYYSNNPNTDYLHDYDPDSSHGWSENREATPKEKHWLKTFMEGQKIPFDKAMETFDIESTYEIY